MIRAYGMSQGSIFSSLSQLISLSSPVNSSFVFLTQDQAGLAPRPWTATILRWYYYLGKVNLLEIKRTYSIVGFIPSWRTTRPNLPSVFSSMSLAANEALQHSYCLLDNDPTTFIVSILRECNVSIFDSNASDDIFSRTDDRMVAQLGPDIAARHSNKLGFGSHVQAVVPQFHRLSLLPFVLL